MHSLRVNLERTLAGNKNAFAEVVVLFQDMAMAVAMRRLNNRALAEEAVQEAFAQSWFKLGLLQELDAFPGWFRTILHRCCLRIRQQTHDTQTLPNTDVLAADFQSTDPYTVVTRYLDQQQVRSILKGLSEPYREACLQRYVLGRSYKDIAATLGLPLGTLKRRLHDVRDRILNNLDPGEVRGIRIGCLPISDHLLLMAAHHLYNGRVFQIILRKYLTWSSLLQALNTRMLDAALVMAPLAMALRTSGMPIRYVLDCHHEGSALTMREGAHQPWTNTPVMAFPHEISTHRMLLHLYDRQLRAPQTDLPLREDFTPQYISPSYVIGSLVQHKIDGFFCSEPWSTKSVAQGVGKIMARSKDLSPGHSCCILVVRESFVQSAGAQLESFLSLLEEAGKYMTMHPREGARILTQYTGVERDIAEHVLCNHHITFTDLRPDLNRTGKLMHLALETLVLRQPCDLRAFMGI